MEQLRLILTIGAILTIPGWALLTLGDTWRVWRPLQRWCLAVSLSIAFWPILFYWTSRVLPAAALDARSTLFLLLGLAGWTVFRLRHHLRRQLILDRLEWLAMAVFAATLATRFWVVRGDPYPAWTDSLHHTILTQLTASAGRLPISMLPYFPISLDQYHLGLYALTAVVRWGAQQPAHEALLYTAQALSGLCGLGVYLTLDRLVGRWPAIWGAVTVGLLSHLPSYYVNWGRFTQLASQTVMLAAWLVTWQAVRLWLTGTSRFGTRVAMAALAAALNASVFLLHFRVAGFHLPWLVLAAAWFWPQARAAGRLRQLGQAVLVVSILSLVLVLPAVVPAVPEYVRHGLEKAAAPRTAERAIFEQQYHDFPLTSWPYLVARPWLLALALLAAGWRLLRRDRMVTAVVVWVLALLALGHASRLSLPLLGFTNLGAVLVLLYLPIGLVVGAATVEVMPLLRRVHSPHWRLAAAVGAAFLVLVAVRDRARDIEPYRHFVTPADVTAMDWIRSNTPSDAVFAVNTVFWLPRAPHGTDGGYWIPYFTDRRTTTGAMLHGQGEAAYEARVVAMSRAVVRLVNGQDGVDELRRLGVRYIYLGPKGNFAGPPLDRHRLAARQDLRRVYDRDGVTIFVIRESTATSARSATSATGTAPISRPLALRARVAYVPDASFSDR